jgi:hypothetical protein
MRERKPCTGYLAYPFNIQEVNNQTGNLHFTDLLRRLQRKKPIELLSALFGNGYAM